MKYVLLFVGTREDQDRWAHAVARSWPGGPVEVWPVVED